MISPLICWDIADLSCPGQSTASVMSVLAVSDTVADSNGYTSCHFDLLRGAFRKFHLLLKLLLALSCIICSTNSELADNLLKAPSVSPSRSPLTAPAVPDLPLPADLPGLHGSRKRHFSPHGAPGLKIAPAHPPFYDPLVTSGHPSASSHLSRPLMKRSKFVPPSAGLADIAPVQSSSGAVPSGLAQPPLSPYVSDCCKPDTVLKRGSRGCHCVYPIKLDLLLLNVSQNPNWNAFLNEFAGQLGLHSSQIELINFYVLSLSRLNISMDITPHTGISFSASEASAINSSLFTHKVHFDSTLVGDYKLLNLTWFEPPAPSRAPLVASSPVEPPTHSSSSSPAISSSKKGKHSSLVLIFGISASILIIGIIFVVIICSCALRDRKTTVPAEETTKPRTADAVPAGGSFPHPTSTRFLAYEELKEATNNFEPASILGEGGFGRVFKGILSDGTAVAIKRLTSGGQQGDKEFLVEVEMLSRLHHRNLVKLVGYYSSRDSSQNLLCYELVPNGSLEAWLHGNLCSQKLKACQQF